MSYIADASQSMQGKTPHQEEQDFQSMDQLLYVQMLPLLLVERCKCSGLESNTGLTGRFGGHIRGQGQTTYSGIQVEGLVEIVYIYRQGKNRGTGWLSKKDRAKRLANTKSQEGWKAPKA